MNQMTTGQLIAVRCTGLVASVGMSVASTCAAMRARISNPTLTRYLDSRRNWISGHQVVLDGRWNGLQKLARMAVLAIQECLEGRGERECAAIPLLLCVAERCRPGRIGGLDDELLSSVQKLVGARFAESSRVIAGGRVGVLHALDLARTLIGNAETEEVLVVAVDTLLVWQTLSAYEDAQRLLAGRNSNGFMPGEGAGAVLVGAPVGGDELTCHGIGHGMENSHVDSDRPLRGDGLTQAIRNALRDGMTDITQLAWRIVDLSGEHYYFKEAALALGRLSRSSDDQFDTWHPAESIGESGALIGAAAIAWADQAERKAYAPGAGVLMHMGNDGGERSAAIFRFRKG